MMNDVMKMMPQSEDDWKAYSDANTLIGAESIRKDETRMKKAMKWVEQIAADKAEEVKAVQSVLDKKE